MKAVRWYLCLLVLAPASSYAAFGEENLTLGAILKQNIEQSIKLAQTVHYMRLVASEAADTAFFVRDSVKAANNVRLIFDDPVEFSRYALRSWVAAYPEMHNILAHAIDMRMALGELRDPEFYKTYDPYAYVRAFDSLQNVEKGAYEIAVAAVDRWHVHEPHDEVLATLKKEHKAANDALNEMALVINGLGLSPNRAQVHTAKHTAISAMASVQAATALEKMAHLQQVEFMSTGDASDAAFSRRQQMVYDATRVSVDWRLMPGRGAPQ